MRRDCKLRGATLAIVLALCGCGLIGTLDAPVLPLATPSSVAIDSWGPFARVCTYTRTSWGSFGELGESYMHCSTLSANHVDNGVRITLGPSLLSNSFNERPVSFVRAPDGALRDIEMPRNPIFESAVATGTPAKIETYKQHLLQLYQADFLAPQTLQQGQSLRIGFERYDLSGDPMGTYVNECTVQGASVADGRPVIVLDCRVTVIGTEFRGQHRGNDGTGTATLVADRATGYIVQAHVVINETGPICLELTGTCRTLPFVERVDRNVTLQ